MGNFKIEIEAIGGHGVCRNIAQGCEIPYGECNPTEPDAEVHRFVSDFAKRNHVVSARLTHWPDTTPIVDNLLTGVREYGDFNERWQGEELLRHFEWHTVPEHARAIARDFCHLAYLVVRTVSRTPERTVALRKLLEGRDAAVRAVTRP